RRRLNATRILAAHADCLQRWPVRRQNVRFGSEADIALQKRHVRFAPYSDRESVPPQNAMPALLLKADTCSAMLGRVIPIKSPISLNPTASMRRAFSKGWPIP